MSNPNHDPQNGEFSSGGGFITDSHKERLRGVLSLIHDEHKGLVNQLHSNTIDGKGLDRLDAINKFVMKNKTAISALKK